MADPLRVCVGCEFSGIVREAVRRRGHYVRSCDLLPAEDGSPLHYQADIFEVLARERFDPLIVHPPCTHLSVSGARWFKAKQREQAEALEFVQRLMDAEVEKIALENPVSIISSRIRKPDQIVQPFHFGDPYRKTTCPLAEEPAEARPDERPWQWASTTRIVVNKAPAVWPATRRRRKWNQESTMKLLIVGIAIVEVAIGSAVASQIFAQEPLFLLLAALGL